MPVSDAPAVHNPPSGMNPQGGFAAFMRNYQDMVFTTAARLLADDAQAEDVSQEVFLKAHRHYAMLEASPTAGGWLKTVTTNLCLNHLSRYRRRWRFFSELSPESDDEGSREVEFAAREEFFDRLDAAERHALVEQALAKLPASQRVPLVLHHFQEISYEDIARRLGVSLAKVKTDIFRGRLALAKILSAHA
jgi:RNA polymerase sigma-70 factor (ECF subfamily)